jgi:hypothetical protein
MGLTGTRADEPHQQVEHVREDLRKEFPSLPGHLVDLHVRREEDALAGARVHAFVPVLVRRGARERLRRYAGL